MLFYIVLCVVVLCTQICALILLKRDHNFRVNEKYLITALCRTKIVLSIQFVMRGVRFFINSSVGINLTIHFGGTAGGLLYLFVMTIVTLDRLAEIKFILKYPLYCTIRSTVTIPSLCFFYFMFDLRWFVNKFH